MRLAYDFSAFEKFRERLDGLFSAYPKGPIAIPTSPGKFDGVDSVKAVFLAVEFDDSGVDDSGKAKMIFLQRGPKGREREEQYAEKGGVSDEGKHHAASP